MTNLNKDVIKKRIKEKGYLQKDLAKEIGMSARMMLYFLNSDNATSLEKFIKLMLILDLELKDVVIEEENI